MGDIEVGFTPSQIMETGKIPVHIRRQIIPGKRDLYERVYALRLEGRPLSDIAAICGFCSTQRVHQILKKLESLGLPYPHQSMSSEKKRKRWDRIMALLKTGMLNVDVAKTVGVDASTVSWLKNEVERGKTW